MATQSPVGQHTITLAEIFERLDGHGAKFGDIGEVDNVLRYFNLKRDTKLYWSES